LNLNPPAYAPNWLSLDSKSFYAFYPIEDFVTRNNAIQIIGLDHSRVDGVASAQEGMFHHQVSCRFDLVSPDGERIWKER
jgi:hypothetical protein